MSDTSDMALGAATRTPKFEARLKQRYRAERNFKLLGLGAIMVSVAVLLFLLITMGIKGASGFQRAEVNVPIDFTQAGLSYDSSQPDEGAAVRSLEGQGLPQVVEFFAAKSLGEEGASEISGEAWREVASAIIADPSMLATKRDLFARRRFGPCRRTRR